MACVCNLYKNIVHIDVSLWVKVVENFLSTAFDISLVLGTFD